MGSKTHSSKSHNTPPEEACQVSAAWAGSPSPDKPPGWLPADEWQTLKNRQKDAHVYATAIALHKAGLWRSADKLQKCHKTAWDWRCSNCGQLHHILYRCCIRVCPYCASNRSYQIKQKYHQAVSEMQEPKLLVLTDRSVSTLDHAYITSWQHNFQRLRDRKAWRDRVRGGLAGYETTHTDAGWHFHLHGAIDSSYLPLKLLRDAWKDITGGAWIVRISQADPHAGLAEVVKYISKGSTFHADPLLLAQYLDATYRRRHLTTFGNIYRHPSLAKPSEKPASSLERTELLNDPGLHIPHPVICDACAATSFEYHGVLRLQDIPQLAYQKELP